MVENILLLRAALLNRDFVANLLTWKCHMNSLCKSIMYEFLKPLAKYFELCLPSAPKTLQVRANALSNQIGLLSGLRVEFPASCTPWIDLAGVASRCEQRMARRHQHN